MSDFDELLIFGTDPLAPEAPGRFVRYWYDRKDRLTSAQYTNGFSLLYQYDGNGNIVRQLHLIEDRRGLPVAWRYLHGLTNSIPADDLYGDADADDWSNYEEWKAGSDPASARSVPDDIGVAALSHIGPLVWILPEPSAGYGLSTNELRVLDPAGSPTHIEMQLIAPGWTEWTNASIVSIDSQAPSVVSSPLAGATHELVWNAARDLGVPFTNDENLRVRGRNASLAGDWSASVTYHVAISAGNPQAVDDSTEGLENTPVSIDVLLNDTVQPPTTKNIASITQPSHGSAITNADRTIHYSPVAGFRGIDRFNYVLTDGVGGFSMAVVTVTVKQVNQPPQALPREFTVTEDHDLILGWNDDRDAEGDVVTLVSVVATAETQGTVTLNGRTIRYRPNTNFAGTNRFNYIVSDNGRTDGTNDFRLATNTITVVVTPVNDPPLITAPASLALLEDTSLVVRVNDLGNTGEGGPLGATNSVAISITPVNDLPEVILLAPADGATFITNELVTITGAASDADDTNLTVEFLVNSTPVSTFTTAGTNSASWSTSVAGNYRIAVRAKDPTDQWVYSRTNTVAVQEPGLFVIEEPKVGPASFSMVVTGRVGQVYEVQSATSLEQYDWTPAGALTNTTGRAVFTQPLDTNATKYYRALLKE